MTINQHHSVSHVFSVPNWSEMLMYWQFFYYRPPSKFTVGEIVKMLCQELDIYMYMMLSIIDMDFLYQFNLRLIAPLFTVSFREMFEKKKNVFEIFKSWQVCDWLAKWIIMLGFMDLRWPRVFRRSNVGLVYLMCFGVYLSCRWLGQDSLLPKLSSCQQSWRGYTGFTLFIYPSVHPSVHPSICL